MNIKKRDGRIVSFDKSKIEKAVLSAFNDVDHEETEYAAQKAQNIANYIEEFANKEERLLTVEEVQDLVEKGLMSTNRKDVAKNYILYREERNRYRGNLTDSSILDLLEGSNEYWNTENSNKNATIVTVQRDYLAGIASTDIAKRKLLPDEVRVAHEAGIIHQHDMDYMAQNALNNCCLINLEDMLMNGTVINGIRIDPQKRLLTATTVATQIITAVASSQYGGTTITLTHLAPFVRMSYERYYEEAEEWFGKYEDTSVKMNYAKAKLKEEIRDSVQTFNYQINSMSTTNGQAPFISVNMYLGEDKEYTAEIAMLIEEFLRQRIKGLKNEKGVYITQAFPKLLYVLEEDNVREGSKYWGLTKLAAACSAKRMVPDYISEKVMLELKINPTTGKGECYPCINETCA